MLSLIPTDIAITIIQVILGVFFFGSGFHKTFVPEVHAKIVGLFKRLGCYNPVNEWLIPIAEMMGGLALIIGFLTPVAAGGLIVILIGAICLDCWPELVAKHPRDWLDWLVKAIYMPELLMSILLLLVAISGDASKLSVDYWLLHYM